MLLLFSTAAVITSLSSAEISPCAKWSPH
ncbi:unnamed protein product, partial [Rotaria sordida]